MLQFIWLVDRKCRQEKRPHQTPKVVSAHRADDDLATTNSQAVYAGHSSPTQPMAQPAAGILESNNPISLQLVLSSVAQGTSLKLVLDLALPLIRACYSSTQSDLIAAALGSLTCHMLFTNMAAYASFDEFLVVLAPARITHLVPTDLPLAVTPAAHEIHSEATQRLALTATVAPSSRLRFLLAAYCAA